MKVLISVSLLFLFFSVHAQQVVKLWGDGSKLAPTSSELTLSEVLDTTQGWLSPVIETSITIYLPTAITNKRMAVVICPGGGYGGLAIEHEGYQFAQWLQKQGIAGIVLKYRMPNGHKQVPLEDGQAAIRYVREHAKEWDIDLHKIGVAGFSAGGHLAATLSTHYAQVGTSTRPDFSILFYPVITMSDYTHHGSRDNLLGTNPSVEDKYIYSNEKQVNVNTPPAILLLSDDDDAVPTQNSVSYYQALKRNNIAASLYIFPHGGHGWGMHANFEYHQQMLTLLQMWLKNLY